MFGSLRESPYRKALVKFQDRRLLEDSRKDIMNFADPRCRARARRQNISCRYVGMNDEGTMLFKVKSGTTPGLWYDFKVRFKDVKRAIEVIREKDPKIRDLGITRALMNGDIECSCSCVAWTYWGWAYRATQRGYGIDYEDRAPRRNLAYLGTSTCKHGVVVLTALPFYASKIVGEFRARGLLPNRSSQKDNSNVKEA